MKRKVGAYTLREGQRKEDPLVVYVLYLEQSLLLLATELGHSAIDFFLLDLFSMHKSKTLYKIQKKGCKLKTGKKKNQIVGAAPGAAAKTTTIRKNMIFKV